MKVMGLNPGYCLKSFLLYDCIIGCIRSRSCYHCLGAVLGGCNLLLKFSDLFIKSLPRSCIYYKRVEREGEELLENRRKNPDLYDSNSYWVMLRCPVLGLFSERIQ